jgi:hypothetical protein
MANIDWVLVHECYETVALENLRSSAFLADYRAEYTVHGYAK